MDIKIYTYCNPYEITKEPFFNEIKDLPQFCISQTMVNGMRKTYPDLKSGQLSTMDILLDNMYEKWRSTEIEVKQYAALDNITHYDDFLSKFPSDSRDKILHALLNNRKDVFQSIRTMIELGVEYNKINKSELSFEQKILVELFSEAIIGDYSDLFDLKKNFDLESIDKALNVVLSGKDGKRNIDGLDFSSIVIHGIHQFTPLMLRAIEELSKYKKLILIFNYQRQYSQLYKTWVNVYSAFNVPIVTYERNEYRPTETNPVSLQGNILADSMAQMIEGKRDEIGKAESIPILEFDNITEFANYVAGKFEDAVRSKINDKSEEDANSNNTRHRNVLSYMNEQFYSADMKVNDILKIYFPKQFGERNFLDFPIGHFFLSITEMWNPDEGNILINNLNDVKECLSAGVIQENEKGELLSLFNKAEPLFIGVKNLGQMIKRLEKVKKEKARIEDEKNNVERISYYSLTTDEMDTLINALKDLDKITRMFYEDFNDDVNNFRKFYSKIKAFLQDNVMSAEIDDGFRDIVRRVMERLDEVKDINANASFNCLKDTMSIYLQQESEPGNSAHWIVRGFNQIEGDILQSAFDKDKVYHFACLSDSDMQGDKGNYTWPLDEHFFEIAQEPIDWKFQVYMNSKRESRNYYRYALIYGLEFNRARFRLSYIKHDKNKVKDYYSLLKILGVYLVPYQKQMDNRFLKPTKNLELTAPSPAVYEPYNNIDMYRYRVCHYKFLLESIIEGKTIYCDDFLILRYFEILLENQTLHFQDKPNMESIIQQKIEDNFNSLKKYFPFVLEMNRIDIINKVKYKIISKTRGSKFSVLSNKDKELMTLEEVFIRTNLKRKFGTNVFKDKFAPVEVTEIKNRLSKSALANERYYPSVNLWCEYCACRDICLEFYEKL